MPRRTLALLALLALGLAGGASAFDLRSLNLEKLGQIAGKLVQSASDVPEDREVEIGRGIAASLLGAAPLVRDDRLQAYVNRVGQWLVHDGERGSLPWRFGVIETESINAFAAPGGYVFVTRGLFETLESEAQLAGVLGHEAAHVLRRHHLEALRKNAQAGVVGDVIGMLAEEHEQAVNLLVDAGMQLYARGLDREDEFEADRMGVVIATRAGYEPYGLLEMLGILDGINPEDNALALMLATHPPASERLARLDAQMGTRFDAFAGQPRVAERFVAVRDAWLAREAKPPR